MEVLHSVTWKRHFPAALQHSDSLVAGKYVGKNALAAVGNSYEITLIYMAFAFGCNMGCSVIAAQFFEMTIID